MHSEQSEKIFENVFTLVVGINDTKEDFDEFFSKCLEKNADEINLELDIAAYDSYSRLISETVIDLIQYIYVRALEKNISVRLSPILRKIYENSDSNVFLPENPIKDKYLGCEEFLHTVSFTPSGIRHCMNMLPENAPPLIPVVLGHIPTAKEIIDIKNDIEFDRRYGGLQYGCENCQNIRFSTHNNQPYINKILIAHKNDCNLDCSFCYNKLSAEKQLNYNVIECLNNIKPLLKYGFELHFGGGEATIWEEFDEICDFAVKEKAKYITLSTNGLVFSEKLAELLKMGIAYITLSTDTANKETYRNLKNADFDIVTENIKKYVACQKYPAAIKNKFIIIPEVNDSENEIQNWVDYSVKLGIRVLALDLESTFFYNNRYNIPQRIKDLLNFAQEEIENAGCQLILYSFASQLLYDEKNPK